jgi:hypothetical protein
MPLTPEQRKKKLGHGGLTKVGRKLGLTAGHVAEVNAERRRDARVEREIVRRITKNHPDVDPADVWPVREDRRDGATPDVPESQAASA